MVEQLPGQRRVEDLGEVLGLHDRTPVVELDHETQWQLGELAAQFGTLTPHSWRAEAAAVGFAEAEGHPGHAFDAVAAVGVEFADHAVEVDPLMCEGTEGGVAGPGNQVAEGLSLRAQPHRDGVAVVADGVVDAAPRLSTGVATRKSSVWV